MDAFDKISHCLHDLLTRDTIQYIEACKTLIENSNTIVFKSIMSHKLEDVTKVLVRKSELSDQENLLKYYLHKEKKAGSDFVSLEENTLFHVIENSSKNIWHYSSTLVLHLAMKFDAYFYTLLYHIYGRPVFWEKLGKNKK